METSNIPVAESKTLVIIFNGLSENFNKEMGNIQRKVEKNNQSKMTNTMSEMKTTGRSKQ